jgi:hypothetical protein
MAIAARRCDQRLMGAHHEVHSLLGAVMDRLDVWRGWKEAMSVPDELPKAGQSQRPYVIHRGSCYIRGCYWRPPYVAYFVRRSRIASLSLLISFIQVTS